MKSAAALVIIAIIWCYPLAAEGTLGACTALASQALHIETRPAPERNTPATATLIHSVGDYSVPETAQRRYPLLPSGIVCTGYYWCLLANPAYIDTIKIPNDAR